MVAATHLQQLEHVGEDADTQRQVYSPQPHIQKPAQQHQRAQPVNLTQQHLQHNGQLLWWLLVSAAVCQPELKCGELLTEEG